MVQSSLTSKGFRGSPLPALASAAFNLAALCLVRSGIFLCAFAARIFSRTSVGIPVGCAAAVAAVVAAGKALYRTPQDSTRCVVINNFMRVHCCKNTRCRLLCSRNCTTGLSSMRSPECIFCYDWVCTKMNMSHNRQCTKKSRYSKKSFEIANRPRAMCTNIVFYNRD